MQDNPPYLLQCIRLGMLLQDPNELDTVEPWHFGDPVLRSIVGALKARKVKFDGSNQTSVGEMAELPMFLHELGCDAGVQCVRDARLAIRETVEADGAFVQALDELSKITQVTVNGRLPSEAKRRFAELVLKTAEERETIRKQALEAIR
jgi:hypothetical protein